MASDPTRENSEPTPPAEALYEQREWLRVTLASIGDAVITTDTEGRVTFLNSVAQSLTGSNQEQAAGAPLEDVFRIINEESREPVENPVTKALREGLIVGLANHTLLLSRDGTERPIDDSAAPIRNAQGIVAGVVLVFRDVTERRRQERAVRASELRYRRLFETARDGILLLDAETGKIIDVNPFVAEMLHYEKQDLLDKELWELGLFPDREANQQALKELAGCGFQRYGEVRLTRKTGQHVDVECTSNIYQVNDRSVIQCNVRDITERVQLDRTKIQAEALADLHRRKDEFLAMLSHELRNPLAPILNAVHLLRLEQGNESPVQERARTIIERQVEQLSHLIDDLLQVSRITTGRIRLHKSPVDMRNAVDRAVEAARPLIVERKHELVVSQPADPVWLVADPTRIEQIVLNLLLNAGKYTEPGGRIGVTLEAESDQAVLRVRDTGVGIAPELLPRIFDLFTQSERTLDRSQGGLGIGLSVVQKLTEMHDGKVEAYSALGQGSEFVVRLPLGASPTPQAAPPAAARSGAGPVFRVLVVDDNVDQADSLAILLRAAGHEPKTVYSGMAALDTALAFRPDVAILDIGLPELDGYEVARQMRRHPELERVRLIALTGYGQGSDRRRSLAAGFDYHLVKPINPDELLGILTAVGRERSPS